MKTIKLTNFEVQSILQTLKDPDSLLNSKDPSKKLPISILWKMDENVITLNGIYEKIISKQDEIKQSFSDDEHSIEIYENGTVLRRIKPEHQAEYLYQMSELMSIVNEVSISTINIESLEKYELVPRDYRSIRFMLESDEQKESDLEE